MSSAMPMWKSAPERFGHLFPEERADAAPVDAPHQFADEIALRQGVVAPLRLPGVHHGFWAAKLRTQASQS